MNSIYIHHITVHNFTYTCTCSSNTKLFLLQQLNDIEKAWDGRDKRWKPESLYLSESVSRASNRLKELSFISDRSRKYSVSASSQHVLQRTFKISPSYKRSLRTVKKFFIKNVIFWKSCPGCILRNVLSTSC